jgi:hypothetical protein
MRVRKELLKLGKHHAKGGTLNATREWAEAKVKQTNDLIAKGIKPPVAWGHTSTAMPLDPTKREDEQKFHSSKFKAGDLVGLELEGDKIFFQAEVPGVKRIDEHGNLIHDVEINGETKEAAISEVSGGFWDWTDGQGELHKDALIHVALCPLPVSAGQTGFQPAPQPILLSTSTWFGAIDAIESNDPAKKVTELATEPDMDEPKKPETEEKPTEDKPAKKAPVNVQERLKTIGDKFKIGLPDQLPDNPEDALELLYVAACVVAGPQEEETLTPEPNPTTGSIMLSTAVKESGWAGTAARHLETTTRDGLKSRIELLKKRGLGKEDHEKLLAQVPKLELSLNPADGKVIDTHLHDMLTVLERNLPSRKELATSTELTEEKPPVADAKAKAEETLKHLEEKGIIPKPRAS